MSAYQCFLDDNALAINQARQEHLGSLDLPINNRSVLEVGAGIGLHTQFFLDRGCEVLITDGESNNVAEIQRRHPNHRSQVLDLDTAQSIQHLGRFDIVYCYGLLYHLGQPQKALEVMSEVSDMILLELICNARDDVSLDLVRDPRGANQSTHGQGCRPSRRWILDQLNRIWGHGYITSTQPNHRDFPGDWSEPGTGNTRAVFVGSRRPLDNQMLLKEPLVKQTIYGKGK